MPTPSRGLKRGLAYHLARPIEPWRLALIADHMASVARYIPALDRRYPGEDAGPLAYAGLYLAALTYRPGTGGFHHWLRAKVAGQMSRLRHRAARRCRDRVAFVPLPDSLTWDD